MRRPALRTVLILALLGGCVGQTPEKDDPANSGANAGPGLNSSVGMGQHMEQGSSDADVIAAYNRLGQVICDYDATCDQPSFEEECPFDAIVSEVPLDQCWVVDNALVSQCENELRGLQCEGDWANFPDDGCLEESVRECECLDGYVEAWIEDRGRGCYPPCASSSECTAGTACYDGACTPPQEFACPDEQIFASVNGVEGCYDQCDDGMCAAGFECRSGICIEAPEDPPDG